MKKNIILEKSLDYALITVKLYKHLQSKNEYILSKQLLRSATSVGANVRESNNTLTKKDFVYKLNIAQKELDESIYWLELLFRSDYIDQFTFQMHKQKASEQLKIIKSIILTARNNMVKTK